MTLRSEILEGLGLPEEATPHQVHSSLLRKNGPVCYDRSRSFALKKTGDGSLVLDARAFRYALRSGSKVVGDCEDLSYIMAAVCDLIKAASLLPIRIDRCDGLTESLLIRGVRAAGWPGFASVKKANLRTANEDGFSSLASHYVCIDCMDKVYDPSFAYLPPGEDDLGYQGAPIQAVGIAWKDYWKLLLRPDQKQAIRCVGQKLPVGVAWDDQSLPPDAIPVWADQLVRAPNWEVKAEDRFPTDKFASVMEALEFEVRIPEDVGAGFRGNRLQQTNVMRAHDSRPFQVYSVRVAGNVIDGVMASMSRRALEFSSLKLVGQFLLVGSADDNWHIAADVSEGFIFVLSSRMCFDVQTGTPRGAALTAVAATGGRCPGRGSPGSPPRPRPRWGRPHASPLVGEG